MNIALISIAIFFIYWLFTELKRRYQEHDEYWFILMGIIGWLAMIVMVLNR